MEFATDMEEPVCEGSEEHNHTTECHKRDYCRLNNSIKLVLGHGLSSTLHRISSFLKMFFFLSFFVNEVISAKLSCSDRLATTL